MRKSIDKQIRIAVRIDNDLKKRFYDACYEKSVNPSEMVREMIKQWIENEYNK